MLIKLAGGVRAEVDDLAISVGTRFCRYIRGGGGAYDKGEVVEIRGQLIVVDFLDTVRSFPCGEVTLVYSSGGDEHLMIYGEGTLIKDFRNKRTSTVAVDSVEDLLDFDKWMV